MTLHALDRSPRVNEGEALIVSLGFKLFTEGVYGTDLFAGFHGMERHFFIITPLMSLLQGAHTRVLGMGLWQWRLLAVYAGLLTCALTYRVGRPLVGRRAALLAVALLIAWPWAQADATLMALTGIPLMDVARLVRHDILVAPLGLAAWWAFMRQCRTERRGYALLAGALAGLAGLAHLYGLFWVAAFCLIGLVEWWWRRQRPDWAAWLLLLAGVAAVWLPVAVFILPNRADFLMQAIQSRSRFEVFSPAFYLSNLAAEIHRYHLGWREQRAWLHPGGWTLLLGAPGAWLALAGSAWRSRDRRALWVLAPALVFPVLLALLIEPKTFNYLVAVAPVLALLLAGGVSRLLTGAPRAGRVLVVAGLVIVLLQGGLRLANTHAAARGWPRPADTYAQLRGLIPMGARVLGHQHYWPGLYDREFRSFGLPFMLASANMTPAPVTFRQALEQIAPAYVLLDPVMQAAFADVSNAEAASNTAQFWDFMAAHEARLLVTLTSGAETPLEVYQLDE